MANHWTYHQKTGMLYDPDGWLVETGYSGNQPFVNRPRAEGIKDEGPIPTGTYTFEPAIDSSNLGPCSIPLTPDPGNDMMGRDGFYMHGDTPEMNQTASTGCIIMSRDTRDNVNASETRTLVVII